VTEQPSACQTRSSQASSLELLEEWRVRTREELEFVWQLQAEETRRQLARIWDERLSEMVSVLDGRLSSRISEAGAASARQAVENLHERARRLWQSESRAEWQRVLVEIAAESRDVVALFEVMDSKLQLAEGRGLALSSLEVDLQCAPAFVQAIESSEPVVAAHAESELSAAVVAMAPPPPEGKVALFPVVSQGKASAVLYAYTSSEPADFQRLELLAMVAAGGVAPIPSAEDEDFPASELVSIEGAAQPAKPEWSQLSEREQERHLGAQRQSRVRVAELRLYQSDKVEAGRAQRNLYGVLRDEIDAGREAFRSEHMAECPSMVDYLHLEIVRTLANDDDTLLGPDYPGPLG